MFKRAEAGDDMTIEQMRENATSILVDFAVSGKILLSVVSAGEYRIVRHRKYFEETDSMKAAAITLGFRFVPPCSWINRDPPSLPDALRVRFEPQYVPVPPPAPVRSKEWLRDEFVRLGGALFGSYGQDRYIDRLYSAVKACLSDVGVGDCTLGVEDKAVIGTWLKQNNPAPVEFFAQPGIELVPALDDKYLLVAVRVATNALGMPENAQLREFLKRELGFRYDREEEHFPSGEDEYYGHYRRAYMKWYAYPTEGFDNDVFNEALRSAACTINTSANGISYFPTLPSSNPNQSALHQIVCAVYNARDSREEERVARVHARVNARFDEVVQGRRPPPAADELSTDEEREMYKHLEEQRKQERMERLREIVDAVERGEVPPEAVNSLTSEERQEVRTLAIRNAMKRKRKESTAKTSGIEFEDPALVELFLGMFSVVGTAFKYIERRVREEHDRRFGVGGPNAFQNVKDSHKKGLNAFGVNAFGKWPFGYYRVYARITPTINLLTWSLSVSSEPFNNETGRAKNQTQDKAVYEDMTELYQYKSDQVRNSATLIIALNALWKQAADSKKALVRSEEMSTTPQALRDRVPHAGR
jgi:hypothetical protein